MNQWSLPTLLDALQTNIESRLAIARRTFQHTTTKGDASETVWLELLRTYLPRRYRVDRAHIVDSDGGFSKQIDLVIYDRQFTPPIFAFSGELILPAESVYAVFEVKQTVNAQLIQEANDKFASVADLKRTSVPITNANTISPSPPKVPFPVLGGILALDSDWKGDWRESFQDALCVVPPEKQLRTGCVASRGWFVHETGSGYAFHEGAQATTAWLFNLISLLQDLGTVPAIDMAKYARHIGPSPTA